MCGTEVHVAVGSWIRQILVLRILDCSSRCGNGLHCVVAWWLVQCRGAFTVVCILWSYGVCILLVIIDHCWGHWFRACGLILLRGQGLCIVDVANRGYHLSHRTVDQCGVQVGMMNGVDWHSSHPINAWGVGGVVVGRGVQIFVCYHGETMSLLHQTWTMQCLMVLGKKELVSYSVIILN